MTEIDAYYIRVKFFPYLAHNLDKIEGDDWGCQARRVKKLEKSKSKMRDA